MKECTQTGKPRIDILMAVYNPNMDWLRRQLLSLNAQTWPNLHLYVKDDCSPDVPFPEIQAMVESCITAFGCTVTRNERNLGSNLTFQQLTREAEGDLFAYCDQDDEWLPEKLEVMAEDMARTGALLVCCDVSVIDGEGNITAQSIRQVRRRCVMRSGDDLAEEILTHNSIFGCAMLVDGPTARSAVPFCPHYYHDHYLALWCAERGSIYAQPRALIRYRIHGTNQTGLMQGVRDRETYLRQRIQSVVEQMEWLLEHFPCREETKVRIQQILIWAQARKAWWQEGRQAGVMLKYRHFGTAVTVFELVLGRMPEKLLLFAVEQIRKNRI